MLPWSDRGFERSYSECALSGCLSWNLWVGPFVTPANILAPQAVTPGLEAVATMGVRALFLVPWASNPC